MKRALLLAALLTAGAVRADEPDHWTRLKLNIEKFLGRPYGWGATGLKSFDCSGFVWRVYAESGVLLKRTTARKLWLTLPAPPKGHEHAFGNLVFFDNLTHVAIVNDKTSFYHAQTRVGTHLCAMSPFWRSKLVGERAAPSTDW
jgi:cell wall-associated NlpC family hydrolase